MYDLGLSPLSLSAVKMYQTTADVWRLDLQTFQWWLDRPHPRHHPIPRVRHCGTPVNDRLFVSYGGINYNPLYPRSTISVLGDTWGYDTKTRMWTRFLFASSSRPISRYFCSLVSLKNGSAILFGGNKLLSHVESDVGSLNDMWLLTITDRLLYGAQDIISSKWTRLQPHDEKRYLPARFNHMASNRQIFVDIWRSDLSK